MRPLNGGEVLARDSANLGSARLQRAGRCILRRRTLIETSRLGTASAVKQLAQVRDSRKLSESPARRMRVLPNLDTRFCHRRALILLWASKSCINSSRFKIKPAANV